MKQVFAELRELKAMAAGTNAIGERGLEGKRGERDSLEAIADLSAAMEQRIENLMAVVGEKL